MPRRWTLDDLSRGGPAGPGAAPRTRATAGAGGAAAAAAGGTAGPAGSGSTGSGPGASTPPPGLREEVGATRGAAMRLAKAHITLAQAEFAEIANEIKRLAIGAGIAFALLLFAGMLVPIGSTLFVGEWLFGSIGWGVLHGAELSIAIAVAAVLGVLGASRRQLFGSFLLAVVVGVIVGVVLGLDLTNQGWTRVGDELMNRFEPGIRPLITAVVIVGGVIAVVGLLAGLVSGGIGGAIGGLIGGAILGAILGAFTAIAWGAHAGAAAGVAVGLIVWPAALGTLVMRHGLDFDAIKKRLIPNETIDTTRETIEWVRTQTPLGRKS